MKLFKRKKHIDQVADSERNNAPDVAELQDGPVIDPYAPIEVEGEVVSDAEEGDSQAAIEADKVSQDVDAEELTEAEAEAIEGVEEEIKGAQPKKRRFSFGLKLLDMYILKKFLGTYFLTMLLVMAVVAMFDITEKLEPMMNAPLKETLFDYFASFLPYMANMLSPLFVFISVIFFTSKMAGNSEIIAIYASGVSFRRLLLPYMIGAAIIAALTFGLTNYWLPPSNIHRIAYTNKYVKNKRQSQGVNIMLQVKPGVVAGFGRFDNDTKTGYRFSLDKFDGHKLVSRLTAQTVNYDTTRQYHWKVKDYTIRDLTGMNERLIRGATMDTIIAIEPSDFIISSYDAETMTTPQLSDYIEKQKMRGVANIQGFEIEKQKRIASIAAAFILTLIGMALSSKKVKGGMGINIGVGLALSFGYILFSTVTSSFAISGETTPFIAMEIPNFVYLIIAFIVYKRASKT